MKINKIADLIDGQIRTNNENTFINDEFVNAFSSDLMSDVLRITSNGTILITGLCNIQTIRTAEMAEIHLIILARQKVADESMISLAEENSIAIIETEYSVFKVSGLLYNAGIIPIY